MANAMEILLKDGTLVQVDEQDAHFLATGTWRFDVCGRVNYVRWSTTVRGKRVQFSLHRLVMGAKRGEIVDHIDGDTRNNQRSNLRLATSVTNARNAGKRKNAASRFKGVTVGRVGWIARIWDGKKNLFLGTAPTEPEAAYRYDLASLDLHGHEGRRNFLPLVR